MSIYGKWIPATIGGGTLTDGTGTATGSPITLVPGANTPTITAAGTFTIVLPLGNVGTAATGGWTVTGSPVTLVGGSNTITVETGGANTITVTTATTTVIVDLAWPFDFLEVQIPTLEVCSISLQVAETLAGTYRTLGESLTTGLTTGNYNDTWKLGGWQYLKVICSATQTTQRLIRVRGMRY